MNYFCPTLIILRFYYALSVLTHLKNFKNMDVKIPISKKNLFFIHFFFIKIVFYKNFLHFPKTENGNIKLLDYGNFKKIL